MISNYSFKEINMSLKVHRETPGNGTSGKGNLGLKTVSEQDGKIDGS